MRIKEFTKTILKLALAVLATYSIYYPYKDDINRTIYRLTPANIAQNSVIYAFSQITRTELDNQQAQQGANNTLEHLTEETLHRWKEEGNQIYTVEDKDTYLKIASVDIYGKVIDGEDATALDRGFWYYPLSAPLGAEGNSVIIAHRFQYLPPRTDTFFNLDKVQIGDRIEITQKNRRKLVYTVVNIKVVEKDDYSVLQNTKGKYMLTLITCTPLWTSDQRLVIQAQLNRNAWSL